MRVILPNNNHLTLALSASNVNSKLPTSTVAFASSPVVTRLSSPHLATPSVRCSQRLLLEALSPSFQSTFPAFLLWRKLACPAPPQPTHHVRFQLHRILKENTTEDIIPPSSPEEHQPYRSPVPFIFTIALCADSVRILIAPNGNLDIAISFSTELVLLVCAYCNNHSYRS